MPAADLTLTTIPRRPEVVSVNRNKLGRETSRRIEEVALDLMIDRGYDEISPEEIADASGVSRRTFFRHFPGGKEELVLRDFARRTELLHEALAARPPHEPALEALRQSVLASASSFDADREAALARARILESRPELFARMVAAQALDLDALVNLIAVRLAVDPSVDMRPTILVSVSLTALTISLRIWMSGSARTMVDLVSEAFDLISGGLGGVALRSVS
jgi:AcrR family transcriptional regulator